MADRPKSRLREWIESILFTFVFVWIFTNHVAQATEVPSESMKPSILAGDHFFIDKIAFPGNYPEVLQQYLPGRTVGRGDIVAFWSPKDPGVRLVKRVIGLPGETVEIRSRQVFIDGKPLTEPYKIHVDPGESPDRDNFGPTLIPMGRYFMLGDNRDNSNDSRFWGFARSDDMIGKPLFIYWSYDTDPYNPSDWTLADYAYHYTSVARNFFSRTRWIRTGAPVR